jgi:BirA family transcriptional regulator, biotin operon repressor / biotin---[acetyl-CoA-carboxylase] ligase
LIQPVILHFDSLNSTNTEAIEHALNGAPEGLCVVAREQTKGRGRASRQWISQKDAGLYFSIVLRPRVEMRVWPLISLMAALATTDALLESCNLIADIKWPNDIYVKMRKLGGILAETVETKKGRACILGIGINLVDQTVPSELSGLVTSIERETKIKPDKELLLRALVQSIDIRYQLLHAGETGIEETVRAWMERSSYSYGKRVKVDAGSERFEGTTCGLETDGALRVETKSGDVKVVRSGDVIALRQI